MKDGSFMRIGGSQVKRGRCMYIRGICTREGSCTRKGMHLVFPEHSNRPLISEC